jgi:hypothetical protein
MDLKFSKSPMLLLPRLNLSDSVDDHDEPILVIEVSSSSKKQSRHNKKLATIPEDLIILQLSNDGRDEWLKRSTVLYAMRSDSTSLSMQND